MNNSSSTLHPVAISQVIVNFAASHGMDLESCLLGTGISQGQLCDADALITREQEMRLIENLMLALPEIPALGCELGLRYSVSTFGIWGFALRTSRNLREAAQRALRYLPLSTAYCQLGIVDDERGFGISADPSSIPQHLRQLLLERDLATGINLLRELGLAGIEIKRLEFHGPAPDHAARITELCGVQPQYRRQHNVVLVHREDADKPLPMYDAHLVRLLEDQCRVQLERRQTTGITGQVRGQLLGPLGLVSSLEDVAKNLALSPRSLRRKLDEEGTNFRAVLENERKLLAKQLLQSTQMKLDELAIQLGYADTASFTRAFRRWFGQSPGQYRSACSE
ncbi:MAG: AraC family transcriptional regulator [Oceanococcus sp.]